MEIIENRDALVHVWDRALHGDTNHAHLQRTSGGAIIIEAPDYDTAGNKAFQRSTIRRIDLYFEAIRSHIDCLRDLQLVGRFLSLPTPACTRFANEIAENYPVEDIPGMRRYSQLCTRAAQIQLGHVLQLSVGSFERGLVTVTVVNHDVMQGLASALQTHPFHTVFAHDYADGLVHPCTESRVVFTTQ